MAEIPSFAAYLRDSGGEDQDLSISQQESAIKDWAVKNGFIITRWFRDAARPGSSVIGREKFQEMMAYLRAGDCPESGLVVWSMSRFAREINDSQFFRADLRQRGYKVVSITDSVPEGPEGIFFEAAIDWMNARFLEDLSSHVRRGLSQLVSVYGAIPGTPPRGFKREPVALPDRRDGRAHIGNRWVPDPEVTPRVQQAFAMRAIEKPLSEINAATKLYKGVNCFKFFFTNELYIGILKFGDLTIEHYCEPVIDQKTWEAVQTVTRKYSNRANLHTVSHPRRSGSSYLLSGLVYCGKCGSPLFGSEIKPASESAYKRYDCTAARRRRDCEFKPISCKVLDAAVLGIIKERILQPDIQAFMQDKLIRDQQAEHDQIEKQIKDMKARLVPIRRKINNIIDAIAENGPTRPLNEKLHQLELEESDLKGEIEEANARRDAPIIPYTIDQIQEIVNTIRNQIEGTDQALVRRVLHGIVDKIVVDRNGQEITGLITWAYPLENPMSMGLTKK